MQCPLHITPIWQLLGLGITLRVKHQTVVLLVRLGGVWRPDLFQSSKKMSRMLCFTVDIVGPSFVWPSEIFLQNPTNQLVYINRHASQLWMRKDQKEEGIYNTFLLL
jgi:hypothetical protein